MLLYYRVLLNHGARDDIIKLTKSPKLGALAQLRQGRQQVFTEAIRALESLNEQEAIFLLSLGALDAAAENNLSSAFASDWKFWKSFMSAARLSGEKYVHARTGGPAARRMLTPTISSFSLSSNDLDGPFFSKLSLNAFQRKNFNIVQLEKAFFSSEDSDSRAKGPAEISSRVAQITLFCTEQKFAPSVFDDIKGYLRPPQYGRSETAARFGPAEAV